MVEPAAETRALIAGLLAGDSLGFRTADSGQAALEAIAQGPIDVVLLALNLPDVDGLDLLRRLTAITGARKIVVSARTSESERIAGLEAGADDYIVKPFSGPELIARVRAHLRSRRPRGEGRLEYSGFVIDSDSRKVFIDGTAVELRHREFDLLAFLAASPGQAFSRAQLLDQVWGSSVGWQGEATVTEHIRRIRNQIEADPRAPKWIRTVHRVGYRFERRGTERR